MTDNPALKTCPFCHGSGHKDDAKATLQGVCGNLRNDGYLVPLSVLTRAIEFLPTLEPQGYNEWIDTYKVTSGPYAYSNADMVMAFSAGQASTTGKPKAKTLEWDDIGDVSMCDRKGNPMTDTSQPKWIWASFLDPTDDCGSFCAPRPHMNGGPPNNDAIKYIRSDIYETQAARIAELEAQIAAWEAIEKGRA